MENNATPQGGFWMLVEELSDEFFNETSNADVAKKEDLLRDGYDFYPDAGF
ncbi:MAG TPA: hypothetical protein VK623_03670 [Flavobacterium sp.]|nr:hypothetical protein [Flavobacterium sp.]